jgi:RHS repeat-associated protein
MKNIKKLFLLGFGLALLATTALVWAKKDDFKKVLIKAEPCEVDKTFICWTGEDDHPPEVTVGTEINYTFYLRNFGSSCGANNAVCEVVNHTLIIEFASQNGTPVTGSGKYSEEPIPFTIPPNQTRDGKINVKICEPGEWFFRFKIRHSNGTNLGDGGLGRITDSITVTGSSNACACTTLPTPNSVTPTRSETINVFPYTFAMEMPNNEAFQVGRVQIANTVANWSVENGFIDGTDVTPEVLVNKQFNTSSNVHTLNLDELPDGNYFWTMRVNNGASTSCYNQPQPFTVSNEGTIDNDFGNISVTTFPNGIGGWQLEGVHGEFFDSGEQPQDDIRSGSYTLVFQPVAGYTTPQSVSVTIPKNEVLQFPSAGNEIATTYVENSAGEGSLFVNFEPDERQEFQFSIDGGTIWHGAGELTEIDAGTYPVRFQVVPNFIEPSTFRVEDTGQTASSVTIIDGERTTITATYQATTEIGSLQVNISPEEANSAGAEWSVDNVNWYKSGEILSGLRVGDVFVYFREIESFLAPQSKKVAITKADLATLFANYTAIPDQAFTGTIQVKLFPNEVLPKGAKWTIKETGDTELSGSVVRLREGNYTIQFADVAGWVNPPEIPVRLERAEALTFEGIYTDGSICPFAENVQIIENLNYASISWDKGDYEQVDLRYRQKGSSQWNLKENIEGNPYLLTGLTANTEYEVALKLFCTTGAEAFGNAYSFKTKDPNVPLLLTYPNGGEVFTIGDEIAILYRANSSLEKLNFYYTDNFGTGTKNRISYQVDNPAGNGTKVFRWNTADFDLKPSNRYRIIIESSLSSTTVKDTSDVDFSIFYDNADCDVVNDLNLEQEYKDALCYLIQRGIIETDYINQIQLDEPILRQDLAKIAFIALYGTENATTPADFYPSMFNDLGDNHSNIGDYLRYAKVLSYLEWENPSPLNGQLVLDGDSPFTRENFNFNPDKYISRKHTLKVFWELANLEQNFSGPTPFSDVCTELSGYGYIKSAKDMGIVQGRNGEFSPDQNIQRKNAFLILYRIMTHPDITLETPTEEDYFNPGLVMPQNFGVPKGMELGSFDFYTKTTFTLPGVAPVVFAHTYNSMDVDQIQEFYPVKPLGDAWTHSYNIYLVESESDALTPGFAFPKSVVHWGNGSLDVYAKDNNEYKPLLENYSELEKVNSTEYKLTSKSKVVYTFKHFGNDPTSLFFLTSITDRTSNTVRLEYEQGIAEPRCEGSQVIYDQTTHRLNAVKVTSSLGKVRGLDISYHTNENRIESVSDPLNRNIQFSYSGNYFCLKRFTDAKGNATNYKYNAPEGRSLLTTIQLPRGNYITNYYDHDRKLRRTIQNGRTKSTTTVARKDDYENGEGKVESLIDTDGQKTRIVTNNNGLPESVETSTSSIDIEYYPLDNVNPANITSSDGLKTNYDDYDENGNPQKVIIRGRSGGTIEHLFSYNEYSDVESYTDPENRTTRFDHTNGLMTSTTSPSGRRTMIARNSDGTIDHITNPMNIKVDFDYNEWGNLTYTGMPVNGDGYSEIAVRVEYDEASRAEKYTSPKNQETVYEFDNNDNVISQTFVGKHKIGYDFDANDNLKKLIPESENVKQESTDITSDEFDRTSKIKYADQEQLIDYNDDNHTVRKITQPNQDSIGFFYDDKERLERTSAKDILSKIEYYGEAEANLTKVVENDFARYTFEYDEFNRLKNYTLFIKNGLGSGQSYTVSYSYYVDGKLHFIDYPRNFGKAIYEYNDDGELEIVKWNTVILVKYRYLDDGRLDYYENSNGTRTGIGYDNAGRATQLRNVLPSHTSTNPNHIATYNFTLDVLGRHKTVTKQGAGILSNPPPFAGNSLVMGYNGTNELTTINNQLVAGYDDNGSLVSKGTKSYSYDRVERLRTLKNGGNVLMNMLYDPLSNLLSIDDVESPSRKRVLITDIRGMGNTLMECDATGEPLQVYVQGIGLVARVKKGGAKHFYHFDSRGSTVAMTDDNAQITHKYNYDPYGKITNEVEADFNSFRYVGAYGVRFLKSDLVYMRERYYDPTLMRFLTQDPVWHRNLYNYAGNEPMNRVDPSGRSWIKKSLQTINDVASIAVESKFVKNAFGSLASNASDVFAGIGSILGITNIILSSIEGDVEGIIISYGSFVAGALVAAIVATSTGGIGTPGAVVLGIGVQKVVEDGLTYWLKGYEETNTAKLEGYTKKTVEVIKEVFTEIDNSKRYGPYKKSRLGKGGLFYEVSEKNYWEGNSSYGAGTNLQYP